MTIAALRPRRAVPRGASCDIQGPVLTLSTFQMAAAWEELASTCVLRPDRDLETEAYRSAYAWMDAQMSSRGMPGSGMLWLWGRLPRRVLAGAARHAAGEVLITIEVPRERALLTDFADWHCVLNDVPLANPFEGEPDEAWLARNDAIVAAGRDAVEATWQDIFDPAKWQEGGDVQATIREIRAEDVVRAVRVRGRRFARFASLTGPALRRSGWHD